MATTYTVTAEFAASVLEIKNPWFIVNADYVVGVYAGRAAARTAKATGLAGKVVSLTEIELKVIELKPVEKAKPAKIRAIKQGNAIEHHSTTARPCKLVWQLADDMPGARRMDVIAKAREMGVAYYTARTQYQLWLQVQKEMAAREATAKK